MYIAQNCEYRTIWMILAILKKRCDFLSFCSIDGQIFSLDQTHDSNESENKTEEEEAVA